MHLYSILFQNIFILDTNGNIVHTRIYKYFSLVVWFGAISIWLLLKKKNTNIQLFRL